MTLSEGLVAQISKEALKLMEGEKLTALVPSSSCYSSMQSEYWLEGRPAVQVVIQRLTAEYFSVESV